MRTATGLFLSLGFLISLGCAQDRGVRAADATPPAPAAQPLQTSRLIVKFRRPDLDPGRKEFLSALSRDAGATLNYVRPMSGGAYVLRVEGPHTREELMQVIERLSKRPDVEYAEPDQRMFHQPAR